MNKLRISTKNCFKNTNSTENTVTELKNSLEGFNNRLTHRFGKSEKFSELNQRSKKKKSK